MPRMAFIGVRISWLMLARNSALAPAAASAWSFAMASSRVRSSTLASSVSLACCRRSRMVSSDCASASSSIHGVCTCTGSPRSSWPMRSLRRASSPSGRVKRRASHAATPQASSRLASASPTTMSAGCEKAGAKSSSGAIVVTQKVRVPNWLRVKVASHSCPSTSKRMSWRSCAPSLRQRRKPSRNGGTSSASACSSTARFIASSSAKRAALGMPITRPSCVKIAAKPLRPAVMSRVKRERSASFRSAVITWRRPVRSAQRTTTERPGSLDERKV